MGLVIPRKFPESHLMSYISRNGSYISQQHPPHACLCVLRQSTGGTWC